MLQKCMFSPSTHLDILHQVLVEVLITLVNGVRKGAVLGQEIKITTTYSSSDVNVVVLLPPPPPRCDNNDM